MEFQSDVGTRLSGLGYRNSALRSPDLTCRLVDLEVKNDWTIAADPPQDYYAR